VGRLAIVFFVIALLGGVFGFSGIAGEASWTGHALLIGFVVLAVVSLLAGRYALS
jgi:uncharacterized membrane protein YtjA (UPF0391 family)